jgi:hypothetical protein
MRQRALRDDTSSGIWGGLAVGFCGVTLRASGPVRESLKGGTRVGSCLLHIILINIIKQLADDQAYLIFKPRSMILIV